MSEHSVHGLQKHAKRRVAANAGNVQASQITLGPSLLAAKYI